MSRGLGKLQKAIFELLQESDRGMFSQDIAYSLSLTGHIPHSLDVSIRRAIKSLKSRGLVESGYSYANWGHESNALLFCWIPGRHPDYGTIETIKAGVAKAAVMSVWGNLSEYGGIFSAPRYKDDDKRFVEYSWLHSRAMDCIYHTCDLSHWSDYNRVYTAADRGIKKLVEEGKLVVIPGQDRSSTYVGLSVA